MTPIILHWYKNVNSILMIQCIKKRMLNMNRPSDLNKLIVMIAKRIGQKSPKKIFSGFLFSTIWIIIQVSLKQIYH